MMPGNNRVFLGERFSVEVNARGLDGSGSRAAWNLRPTFGFCGITWSSTVSSGSLRSPLVPGSLHLWASTSLSINY